MLELTTLRLYLKCDFKRYLDPLCHLRLAADEQNIILTARTDLGASLAPNYYYMHITWQKKAAQEQPYAFCIYVPVQSIEGPVPETIMYVLVCLLHSTGLQAAFSRQPLRG